MVSRKIFIIETDTYKRSLLSLKDSSVISRIEKRVMKLRENPSIAEPMTNQHFGICEIKVGGKYRVYCLKKERAIILFILAVAINHNKNYHKTKEYMKLFSQIKEIDKKYGEAFLKDLETSIS